MQLTYEKNTERKFLNNTLSLAGKWNEGQGGILNSDKAVHQTLHYRSIALKNRTDWVHRTEKGGGFKWISTNGVSSCPQALVVGGDMAARQDMNITTLSTDNNFETLKNLRSHRWTLAVSGQANATYTLFSSDMNHPDVPTSTHGDMNHLRTELALGPMARYVKGTFRVGLHLPVALHYTHLNNADIQDETTDANRLRFRLQPSLTLLWKANDNFTFDGSAGYSASETSWSQLLTATLMQNYRSLSRYHASLNDTYGTNARLKVSFKDIFNGFFSHVEGRWNRTWSDIVYGTTIDAQAHTIVEAVYTPNHSENYILTAYVRKDIEWHTIQLELSGTASRGNSQMLRQSVLTEYCNTNYSLNGTLAFDIVSGYRFNYSASWNRYHSFSTNYNNTYRDFSQQGSINVCLIASCLFFHANVNHIHNSNLQSSRKDYAFVGAGLQLKLSKKVEFNLEGNNLANIRTFTTHSFGDMEEHYAVYHLRQLSVTLSTHLSL